MSNVTEKVKESIDKARDPGPDLGYNSVEANFPKWANDPERIELPPLKNDIEIDPVIDELIEELENEDGVVEEQEKPSFIQYLKASFRRKTINRRNAMRCRFQKLAGITQFVPPATLTIGNTTVGLSEIPPWYDVLRYKLCGFKYQITRCE